jgi:hypothetical protein
MLREANGLRVFESRVLRKTVGARRKDGENYRMRSFVIGTSHQIL